MGGKSILPQSVARDGFGEITRRDCISNNKLNISKTSVHFANGLQSSM